MTSATVGFNRWEVVVVTESAAAVAKVAYRVGARRTVEQLRGDPRWATEQESSNFGALAHQAIETVVRGWPFGMAVDRAVSDTMRRAGTRNPSMHRRLKSVATAYCVHNGPSPCSRVLGTETPCGSRRADIVWTSGARIWIDELKLADVSTVTLSVLEQVMALLVAGEKRWPDEFVGVRLVSLSRPRSTKHFALEA